MLRILSIKIIILFIYADAFEEKGKDGMIDPSQVTQMPKNGISVEISMGQQANNDATNSQKTPNSQSLNQNDSHIPIKTGTTTQLTRNPPYHIKDAVDFEPLYPPQEFILEESLRREAERVAHQENLMNRVVYDCIDPSPYQGNNPLSDQLNADGEFSQFYTPSSSDDYTLVFESRFESGNLRRAIQVYEFEYDLILKPDYNTRGYTQLVCFQRSDEKKFHQILH